MPTPTIVTVIEADAILGTTVPWSSSSTTIKTDALGWAQVYFLDVYSCPTQNYDVPNTVDASIKEAISYLANEHIIKDLFTQQDNKAPILSVRNKVDVIEQEIKYAQAIGSQFKDPFPSITALTSALCNISKGNSVKTINLIRQ